MKKFHEIIFFSGSLCSFFPHSFCFNAFSSIYTFVSFSSFEMKWTICAWVVYIEWKSTLVCMCIYVYMCIEEEEACVWVLIVLRLIIEFFGDFSLQCIFYSVQHEKTERKVLQAFSLFDRFSYIHPQILMTMNALIHE